MLTLASKGFTSMLGSSQATVYQCNPNLWLRCPVRIALLILSDSQTPTHLSPGQPLMIRCTMMNAPRAEKGEAGGVGVAEMQALQAAKLDLNAPLVAWHLSIIPESCTHPLTRRSHRGLRSIVRWTEIGAWVLLMSGRGRSHQESLNP